MSTTKARRDGGHCYHEQRFDEHDVGRCPQAADPAHVCHRDPEQPGNPRPTPQTPETVGETATGSPCGRGVSRLCRAWDFRSPSFGVRRDQSSLTQSVAQEREPG